MPTLSKTVRVLDFDFASDRTVHFVQRAEKSEPDAGFSTTIVAVLLDTWKDLGKPFQVTVTIEPGDTLNPTDDFPLGPACSTSDDDDCEACQ